MKNGTLMIYNSRNKTLDIYNNTDDYGYSYIDLNLTEGNYYVQYTIEDTELYTNFEIMVLDDNKDLILSNVGNYVKCNDIEYTNKHFFYLDKSSNSIKLIIYFTNPSKNIFLKLKNMEIFKFNTFENRPINILLENNPELVLNDCEFKNNNEKPDIYLEQQEKKIKQEILYQFNFSEIENHLDEFFLDNIHLGYTYNRKGLLVKSYVSNTPGFIFFRKPILCNYDDIIIELEIYKLTKDYNSSDILGEIIIHDGFRVIGSKVIDNNYIDGNGIILKIDNSPNIERPNPNGIIYFILKVETFTTSEYIGLVVGKLRISKIDIEYYDKYDREVTEKPFKNSEYIAPQATVQPISEGSDTIESLANIQQAILKLL